MRRGALPPRPAEKEERGAAAPRDEGSLEPVLALGVTRACWTLNCFLGRTISVGWVVLCWGEGGGGGGGGGRREDEEKGKIMKR